MTSLDTLTTTQLAEAWCVLNRGGWPRSLGDREGRCLRATQWDIVRKIGYDECERAWLGGTLPEGSARSGEEEKRHG